MRVPRAHGTVDEIRRGEFECPHCHKRVGGGPRVVHVEDGLVRNLSCPHCALEFDVEAVGRGQEKARQ